MLLIQDTTGLLTLYYHCSNSKSLSICRTNFHTWLNFLLPALLPPTFDSFCSLMATSMHTLTPSIPLKAPYFRPLSLQQIQRLHFPLSFTSSSPGISCSSPPVFCQHPPDVTVRCADTNFNLLDEPSLFSFQQDNDFTCVMKFGGSSVASAERMREVADLICSFPEERPIIVLSAMGKATNNLLLVLHSSLFFLASYIFLIPYKRMDRDKFLKFKCCYIRLERRLSVVVLQTLMGSKSWTLSRTCISGISGCFTSFFLLFYFSFSGIWGCEGVGGLHHMQECSAGPHFISHILFLV